MVINPIRPLKVYYCYSHVDKLLRDELGKQLVALKHSGQITDWHDYEILAGSKWEKEIESRINDADIILLLISPDFMQSRYCYSLEMNMILERHKEGKAYIVPIILRSVHWELTPISNLQVLPKNAKPVTLWTDRDEAFWDVVQGIQKIANMLTAYQFKKQGDAYYVNEQFEKALEYYVQAIHLNPNDAEFYNNRGNTLDSLHNYHDALNAYQEAINLDSKNARAYRNKANILYKLKQYDEALMVCDRAIQIEAANPRAYFTRGSILYELRRFEEAITAYEQSIRFAPTNALSFYMKGSALERLGKVLEAQKYYKRAQLMGYNVSKKQG